MNRGPRRGLAAEITAECLRDGSSGKFICCSSPKQQKSRTGSFTYPGSGVCKGTETSEAI